MSQSSTIAAALVIGFLVYITARHEIGKYRDVLGV